MFQVNALPKAAQRMLYKLLKISARSILMFGGYLRKTHGAGCIPPPPPFHYSGKVNVEKICLTPSVLTFEINHKGLKFKPEKSFVLSQEKSGPAVGI